MRQNLNIGSVFSSLDIPIRNLQCLCFPRTIVLSKIHNVTKLFFIRKMFLQPITHNVLNTFKGNKQMSAIVNRYINNDKGFLKLTGEIKPLSSLRHIISKTCLSIQLPALTCGFEHVLWFTITAIGCYVCLTVKCIWNNYQ